MGTSLVWLMPLRGFNISGLFNDKYQGVEETLDFSHSPNCLKQDKTPLDPHYEWAWGRQSFI